MARKPAKKSTDEKAVTPPEQEFSGQAPAGQNPPDPAMNDPTGEDPPSPVLEKIPAKQAVVVIHGMGEQRPMETLRSFVRAVWESDAGIKEDDGAPIGMQKAGPDDDAGRGPVPGSPPVEFFPDKVGDQAPPEFVPKRSWMAPDTRTGSSELHRITTGKTEDGYRVDFYELYWADIMRGSTFSHLRAWIGGLLLRWPHHVPRDVFAIWIILWLSIALLAMIAIAAAPKLAGYLGFGEVLSEINFLPDRVSAFLDRPLEALLTRIGLPDPQSILFWLVVAGGVVWMCSAFRRIDRVARLEGDTRKGHLRFSKLVALAITVLAVWVVSRYLPLIAGITLKTVLSLVAVVIILIINSFLVPYFGDVARYVQATPETVAQRAAIRERGVRLLRALHECDEDGKPVYGRVVVVGHSLGSIIAYDLLMQFWSEAGPLKQVLEGAMRTRWEAMHDYLDSVRTGSAFQLPAFHSRQNAIMQEMMRRKEAWRITDFVTIGSPLTHAEFLITDNANRFQDLIAKRLLAKSPPHPYEDGEESVYYTVSKENTVERKALHHVAVFGAVRWTNIYDQRKAVLWGDVISGRCGENFGDGIDEHDVRIRRPFGFLSRSRFFTHTAYWDTEALGEEEGTGLTHVGLVRKALRLDSYKGFYPGLGKVDPTYRTASAGAEDPGDKDAA